MAKRRRKLSGPDKPTATERRLIAVHESDKSLTLVVGPALAAVANMVLLLWAVLTVFVFARGAAAGEGQILAGLAAIPVAAFWLLGQALKRSAERIREDRSKPR